MNDPNGYYGLGVIWADFNNIGRPDIYITNDSTPKFLYKNLGNGKFEEIGFESGTALSNDGSEQASMGIAVGDYNHTGRPSFMSTTSKTKTPISIATTAIGTSPRYRFLPVWRWRRCPG